MLPKWFNDWNSANPTDVFGPAILVGVAGSAVFAAAIIISFGNPIPVESTQTGPRGTGMSVTKFVHEETAVDPTLTGYVSSSPVVPSSGDLLAKDVYPNAEPLLGDLTEQNYDRLVLAMRTWTGIPDLLAGEENYQTIVARRMIQMTQNLNEGWSDHVGEAGEGAGVNCYSCHRGQPVPSGIWYDVTPVNEAAGGWAAVQNRATMVSQSTSLPSDALQKYLVDGETIAVHDLEARVAYDPDLPTWQNAERTYSLMNYLSNSLNVNCVFCHNSRAFYDGAQVTPQWGTAQLAIGMVQEINNDYILPIAEVLPEERLGPIHGDAPKAACLTCHKGYQKPLGGVDMITDWPELATTEAPVYE